MANPKTVEAPDSQQNTAQNLQFGCQPDKFDPHTLRLFGCEHPKPNEEYRYHFLSTLDFPKHYREEHAQLMDHLGALSKANGPAAFAEMMPKILQILNSRTAELYRPDKAECLPTAQRRIMTDFVVNAMHSSASLFGKRLYHFFRFNEDDPQKTTRHRDGYSATLLCRNPYILNLRGLGEVVSQEELKALKQQIDIEGRTDRDMGQRKTGRMVDITEDGVDTMLGQKVYDAIPVAIRGTVPPKITVTSGYYHHFDAAEEDRGLAAHSDTFYGPMMWSDQIITHVRERRAFGYIPPLSFLPNKDIYFTTMLYYPEHPKEGFEFMLSTIPDIDNPEEILEVRPEPHDLLVMDNVKTYPYTENRDIMLPATAALHEVKEGSADKSFIAVFIAA